MEWILIILVAVLGVTFVIALIGMLGTIHTPDDKGCKDGKKHKWVFLREDRGYSGYITWSNYTEWKCSKCGEEIRNEG